MGRPCWIACSPPHPPFTLQLTLGNFTTLENTPADFLLLGEDAGQGYGHDEWGLGLCLWHLSTGSCPYEEIMESVTCPLGLRVKLNEVWEDGGRGEFGVVRSLINAEVYEEGDKKDYTLHDTLYRYAVMFGIDRVRGAGGRVEVVAREWLEGEGRGGFERDREVYGCDVGKEERVRRGRDKLQGIKGGWETFMGLTEWEKGKRWKFEDVIEGEIMEELRMGEEGRGGGGEEGRVLKMRYGHFNEYCRGGGGN